MKRSAVDRPPIDVGGTRRFVDGASDGEPVRLIGVVCSESTLQS